MEKPKLIYGLTQGYVGGYNSQATDMMYNHIKKSPEEISQMIRETWKYIKEENISNRILSHFLYLLSCEVDIEWVKDISFEIVSYSLKQDNMEVIEETINLIESWKNKKILDLLYNTEIKEEWLNGYKTNILEDCGYYEK